jgi:type I restriction enzyme S subunit
LYGFSEIYRHEENCITVTARGMVGVANKRDHKFDAIGRVLILRPISAISCFFMSEFINHKIEFSIESTGVPQLTAPQISKYEIKFPIKEKQTHIATILSEMDSEIEALEKKRAKYQLLKQGLMQNLLTGKIRLI